MMHNGFLQCRRREIAGIRARRVRRAGFEHVEERNAVIRLEKFRGDLQHHGIAEQSVKCIQTRNRREVIQSRRVEAPSRQCRLQGGREGLAYCRFAQGEEQG